MAYGSGSMFQRGKKGIWYYQAFANGKRIGPFCSKTSDRKKAQRELDKLLGKRARGEVTGLKRDLVTVGDAIREYIQYAEERLENAKGVKWVLEAHVIPHKLSSIRVSSLTVNDIRKYRSDREAEGAKYTTCNREIAYTRAALRRALKEGRVAWLPYFPLLKEDNARKGFVEESDFLRLLDEFPLPLKAFSCCGYYGGMRRGELLRLEPSDVDLERGFLEIRKSKNKDPRAVPIFDGPMREWIESAMSNRHPGQQQLFVWEDGRPFNNRNFYDKWHAACDRAGISWYIPHDSRRSASRNMRNDGVPQSVRMKVMGHKTDAMDRRYGIVDTLDAQTARDIVSRKRAKVFEIDELKKKVG